MPPPQPPPDPTPPSSPPLDRGGKKPPPRSFTAPKHLLDDRPEAEGDAGAPGEGADAAADRSVGAKMSDYHRRAYDRLLTPARHDAFAAGDKTPDATARTYGDALREAAVGRGREAAVAALQKRAREEGGSGTGGGRDGEVARAAALEAALAASRRAAGVVGPDDAGPTTKRARPTPGSEWEADEGVGRGGGGTGAGATPPGAVGGDGRWAATPPGGGGLGGGGGGGWDATPPSHGGRGGRECTPPGGSAAAVSVAAASTARPRSRWDDATPAVGGGTAGAGPSSAAAAAAGTATGRAALPAFAQTVLAGAGMETPVVRGGGSVGTGRAAGAAEGPDLARLTKAERDHLLRNRPLSDADLDAMLPMEGFKICDVPASYVPVRADARKLDGAPAPLAGDAGYRIPDAPDGLAGGGEHGVAPLTEDGIEVREEDRAAFGALLEEVDEAELTLKEAKERRIMRALLRIKNGTPQQRKSSLRFLTEKARYLGAGPLFDQILPLLMQQTLDETERHLLVKVVDRVLYRLDDLVRPHVHKILVVVTPLLIDEDYYARVEGREIIANLAKAAGLASMIAAMRPDIDHADEYVRNTTARAFSVVASALGVPAVVPFLRAACKAKKSWQARHTGVKIVQQVAILMGSAVLPSLTDLVALVARGLEDDNQKVRMVTALAIAALAEAVQPYGIESFDPVLKPLWQGVKTHRGKGLAAFLKAIGFIIPLMDAQYANFYTREVMVVLQREFASPDEEMRKIILQVVRQCVGTEGVEATYLRDEVCPDFFTHFWVRKMALDRRNTKALVETTHALAVKVGGAFVLERIADDLKDESEAYRGVVVQTLNKIVTDLGVGDVDARLEERLVDGVLYAFQEQSEDDETSAVLDGFASLVTALDVRAKPYLPQVVGVVKWRLNNKEPRVRMQAADLVARVAVVIDRCGEDDMLAHLGTVLYENLGEEFPEVLGSLLSALKGCVNALGMERMRPPIKDLLPRLTPILRNRHEKVLEAAVDLVGRIADKGADAVGQREWMRISFDLLDLLRAQKKAIRRAAVNTFGYIAAAIGPQDVLITLLNNLRVQERQNRVCTTVAVAIVAEACQPFTVLPSLMHEYSIPELNVQNGVLKALSFVFEYVGETSQHYINAVVPLLEDALTDRDLVHRQTAAFCLGHLAMGVAGLGCERQLAHLLNFLWPNVLEETPHLVRATFGTLETMRLALGPGVLLQYTLQGLFHPARKVREVYWRIYNQLYVGAADALTAFYPDVSTETDASDNVYSRPEMDIIL